MFLHNQSAKGCENYYPEDIVVSNGGATIMIVPKQQSGMPDRVNNLQAVQIGPTGPQGPKGDKGEMGITPTIVVGQTRTVPFGEPAEVIDEQVGNEHRLSFVIPQGPQGESKSVVKLIQSVKAREISGNNYTKLISYIILPGDAEDLAVNTNSITINTPGIYQVEIQGYVDATAAVSDVIIVQLEIDGNPLETTAVNVLKGGFDNFHHTVFLNLSTGDNIRILHEGTDGGGTTSDVELIFTRLEF